MPLMSKEEKRIKTISRGSQIEYIKCPLCGMTRPVNSKKGLLSFDNVDLDNDYIYQVRYAGGRDSGFFRNDAECQILKNIPVEHKNIISEILQKCKKIIGIIEKRNF